MNRPGGEGKKKYQGAELPKEWKKKGGKKGENK